MSNTWTNLYMPMKEDNPGQIIEKGDNFDFQLMCSTKD